ncbi:ATP-binding protein [Amycolatopsis taiwanensis]|uniref:ATP-binding protein n=1 Tax=Amycolatopsis taiwanensis TaxID=342230 RepID=UPI0004842A20|nr:tetratricopeptide repeat protein [Amycolatopsis taiwanensis]
MDEASAFGNLLLTHRRAAGMTQADLAEISGVSVRALRDLERGRARAAQRRSAEALADAMGLSGGDREFFLVTAKEGRRRTPRTEQATVVCALPPAVARLLGRERELRTLADEVATGGVISIVGHPGVGKTALAVAAAHQLRRDFPDGCFAVDLRGMDDQPVTPRAALEQLLRALGVPAHQIPAGEAEQSALFRSRVTGRRVLILLDNAADEAQVRPLLASGPEAMTLITCRRALAGLEAARWVWLDPLAGQAAVDLLASIVGADRVAAEPDAAAELASLCGNLPLAVRIAGNRLATRPHWSIAYLAAQLRNERTRLSALSAGDLQVRSAFEMSYRRLSPAARLVFRRLAAVPGRDLGAGLAAVATTMTEPDVLIYLNELVDVSLLQTAVVPGRFQFHDLIRLFARERWEAEEKPDERARLSTAVQDHLIGTATAAGLLFYPETLETRRFGSRDEAAEWLASEGDNWLAAQREAARLGRHREVLDLAKAMHWYSDGRTQERPWDEVFAHGVAAARALGSRADEAKLLNFLAWAQYICLGDLEGGLATLRQALAVAIEAGDRAEQAWANGYLGAVLMRLGRPEEALERARRSFALSVEISFWMGQASIRNLLGIILGRLGRHEEALSVHLAVLSDAEAHRDRANAEARRLLASYTQLQIGRARSGLGEWRQAANAFRDARIWFHEAGFGLEEADAAVHEGIAWREAGTYGEARDCFRLALAIYTRLTAQPQRERVLDELALVPDD